MIVIKPKVELKVKKLHHGPAFKGLGTCTLLFVSGTAIGQEIEGTACVYGKTSGAYDGFNYMNAGGAEPALDQEVWDAVQSTCREVWELGKDA